MSPSREAGVDAAHVRRGPGRFEAVKNLVVS